ncbi:tetratricopeptide repeat protein [Hyunsoonleella flava]|uniref:Tetratricopeptide repeat protein n=1 Tax=Hyunsoonleella flava TaxID=2527939 RepID=A0A4Q9FLU4_9FLAO|nr:tetratricopeptide repeat protein [Hyunsoonleella flava]TBN06777.1 tetratricopeptide repeat protein [Hyunsoonleella flava]
MKKQLIIALAISISTFSFAQKKELKAVEKAIKANNFAEAKSALAVVEPMLGALDDKLMAKYNYLKGVALYANGAGTNADMAKAMEFLNKAKDDYKTEVTELEASMLNKTLEKGNKAYETKKYDVASEYFEQAYNLRSQDTTYLYYAAATAVNVPDYDRALQLYQKLKDLNYTGIQKQYYAVNVETNQKETFNDKNMRDLSVKSKTHKDPSQGTSDSKRGEIVKNVALIYISKGDNEKAIQAIKDAKAEAPNDINLILSEANIYYKMGDTEKFKELMETATTLDPDNPELQYNLGVISADSDQPDEALEYYKKTIELDPNYLNAYINSAAVVLGREKDLIEEMNGLGTSAADDKRYEELREERQNLYRKAIPYLSKALEINPKSESAAKTLMNIYSVLGETDKYKAMKAKVESMGAQ